MQSLTQFLQSKQLRARSQGIEIDTSELNPILFPFQRDVTKWALSKGRCAVFADTGLGKTLIQCEWARLITEKTSKRVLIVAPLSIARQTVRIAKEKLGLEVYYTRSGDNLSDAINITNYEMIHRFNPDDFVGIALDESSILKSIDGVTKKHLIEMFRDTKYKSCYTATPAPNDIVEIGNHAEFLGICKDAEMKAMFFIHANKETEIYTSSGQLVRTKESNDKGQEWRLRHHGQEKFYQWFSSWALSIRLPSDLGYDDDSYVLPELNIKPLFVDVNYVPKGQLFFTGLKGIQDRTKIRHATIDERLSKLSNLINTSDEQWIVWCGLNAESEKVTKLLHNAREVKGADTPESKAQNFEDFQDKKYKVLVTKPKIGGFGMNFQNSHNAVFFGLNDSWEWYYQCIRRQYRFGQTEKVNIYIVLSELERGIYDNVMMKEKQARHMLAQLIQHVQKYERMEIHMKKQVTDDSYKEKTVKGERFTAMLGDSCERLKEIETESVDLSVYSPPFADLYVYSNSERDLGNSKDWNEFFQHYAFIIREVLRVTKQGRLTCVHVSDIPAMQSRDGYIGMKDFPGAVIDAYEKEGWIFTGRAIVEKNPQAQAIRTKSKALLFVQLRKDSTQSRPAIFDQILIFRKDGENQKPVTPVENGEIDNERWINWASGIWTGIQESDTLQYTTAKDKDDEKHICPLQLGTIERCIKLYSNPNEIVLTPFGGIGSEAYQAIKLNRRAILFELKESYFRVAIKNMQQAEQEIMSGRLL